MTDHSKTHAFESREQTTLPARAESAAASQLVVLDDTDPSLIYLDGWLIEQRQKIERLLGVLRTICVSENQAAPPGGSGESPREYWEVG